MSNATSLRARAEKLRHLADFIADEETREDLLKLALEPEIEAADIEVKFGQEVVELNKPMS
jgi:hypothetical protein